ncbi:bifunctional 2',3'-cyclic nucleotide 2'-phosphodiesterase/3'-nucleotidase [Novosphingobium fuchskuhlense]|uniref:Bifunctional 2',3'-cyclic nucleotide 2'-phosphodiesterase/3'-nucleotidase n=1 Tax=Novosphingobium fuchskuhlense TaxID=1117702 RepID=A0A117UX92_9SPHN|nr:bifunctional metallophosphatase/5'-nucleotidase [Novosphingobium fuchskuhlense]KUR72541.1 bifunctional 2',3'-cyclic nucleotide 2'-phosphodiesterase/3'-nucleotidase [Novosphingobium fuchskuhlense]
MALPGNLQPLRVLAASLALSMLLSACAAQRGGAGVAFAPAPGPGPAAPVEVAVLAFNDFHGNLEPPRQSVGMPDGQGGTAQVPAGGAAWLATALDALRARHPLSLTVAAGDLISASPLASSLFLDEPSIEVLSRLGLDYAAVGNHEFDRGTRELQRMQAGGCEKLTAREPCQLERFAGARFRYLAASTLTASGTPLFPASAIRTFGSGAAQVKIGVIGLTLRGTPMLVNPAGIAEVTFADEADTINAEVPKLKAQGADAIVVLIHQGGKQTGAPDPNGCTGLAGEIEPILARLAAGVDLVVSGHTHADYICEMPTADPARPVLLTSAGLYGKELTEITLSIDPAAHRVITRHARNLIVQSQAFTSARGPVALSPLVPGYAPRADIAAYVQRYVDASKAYATRPVGKLSGPADRGEAPAGSTGGPLAHLIADAQLAATRSAGAQIAFMNPYGVRAALVPAADGTITFGDLYLVQPFGNALVTETLSGAEIKAALEQGFDAVGPEQVLAPSAGLVYRYDRRQPVGSRIVAITLNGKPLDSTASYRVTTNGFLALGGDGFTVFKAGRGQVTGPSDIEAFEALFRSKTMIDVPGDARTIDAGG